MNEQTAIGAILIWFVGAVYLSLIIGRFFRIVSDRVKQALRGR